MELSDNQKKQLIAGVLGALIFFVVQAAGAFGIDVMQPRLLPSATAAPSGAVSTMTAGINGYECGGGTKDCLRSLYGRDIRVYSDGGSTVKFWVDGATGSVTLAGVLSPVAASTTVTNSQTITPSASMNFITASVAATITLGTPATNGLYALENTGAYTVTIADSGSAVLAGNWGAGQYDTLWLWFDGTRWVELSRSNN